MWKTDINFLAVLASGVASMVIGFLWYSPALFGKIWMKEKGWSPEFLEQNKKQMNMGAIYFLTFICILIVATVLAIFIAHIGSISLRHGLEISFLAWVGFVATVMFTNMLFSEKKSFKLFLIDSFHWLAVFLTITIILTVWR